jgi:hypothetical protein
VAATVVAIKVDDVAAGGYTADRATARQKKTGRPIRFERTQSNLARAIEGLKQIVAHETTKLALGTRPESQFDPRITSIAFETSEIFHGVIPKLFLSAVIILSVVLRRTSEERL